MKISITATTSNRKWSKALVRHSAALEPLRQAGAFINTYGLPFDILQIGFLDRNEDYARAVGCKGDRLFQVELPAPREDVVNFADEKAFVSYIATSVQKAVKLSGLPKDIEASLDEAIRPFVR